MGVIDQAKDEIAAAPKRFARAIEALLGSRVAVAVAAAFTIAFVCQLIYAPARLPPVGGLSLVQLGLPPLDLGMAGGVLKDAGDAALRQDAPGAIADFFQQNAWLIPYANIAGLVIFSALFVWTIVLQMKNYRRRPEARAA